MASLLHRSAAPADETVGYGPASDQVYDVRRPQGTARGTTVVFVHGGFWRPQFDRAHAGPLAAAFAQIGFHVVVPEYRRAAGGWPQMSTDLRSVQAAVAARSDLPDDVVLVGHSAGGHLVCWLAAQPEAEHVVGVVSLAGCVDLRQVYDRGLGDGAARAMMGSTPQQEPDVWQQADPARLGAPPAPVAVVHGTLDETVPLSISQSYAAAVPLVRTRFVDGADHLDLIDPEKEAFATVLETVISLAAGEAQ